MPRISVVIPVHKPYLNEYEKIALIQCKKILISYDVFLLYPNLMDIEVYLNIFPNMKLLPIREEWLSSLENYNKMKCSLEFYKLFEVYDYLLTYELDSYIFCDKWDDANCFLYDYIGAPWLKNYENCELLDRVGNSGFSMRNVKKCITILQIRENFSKKWSLLSKLKLNKIFPVAVLFWLLDKNWVLQSNNYYYIIFFSENSFPEDIFWSDIVSKLFLFKIANTEDGTKFSFEMAPKLLFKLNGFKLPIGCHAWEKYDMKFWEQYIVL